MSETLHTFYCNSSYEDLSPGPALMPAKNKHVHDKGDNGVDMTKYTKFVHYRDTVFNPYETNFNPYGTNHDG